MRLMRTRSYVVPPKPSKARRADTGRTRPPKSQVTITYDPAKMEELWQNLVLLTSNSKKG
jgi:hypothetical protein